MRAGRFKAVKGCSAGGAKILAEVQEKVPKKFGDLNLVITRPSLIDLSQIGYCSFLSKI